MSQQQGVVFEIDAKSYRYDKAYPSSLASTVSETQWAEFCEEIDKCIYGFKVSRAWTIGVFALFACILLIFVIVPLVLSGVFALPFSLFSCLTLVGITVWFIYAMKQQRTINLRPVIDIFRRNVNKEELVVDYRPSEVNWGPWKMIISIDTNETAHSEQEPGSSDDFTESTPFVFDSTPDGIELSTQPPAYYVV